METFAFTRKEAAGACNISLPTLDAYLRRQDRPMPHIRVGRKIIIPADGLREWLAEEAARQRDGRTV